MIDLPGARRLHHPWPRGLPNPWRRRRHPLIEWFTLPPRAEWAPWRPWSWQRAANAGGAVVGLVYAAALLAGAVP